mgnify:CR=1 FL=1|jgi:hypothetical protein
MTKHIVTALMLLVLVSDFGIGAVTAGEYPIAGTQPSQRPVGAPVIREVQKPEGWYEQALTGITKPYPASLRFLENQGNWHTPFNHPGMYGRYDIRGWHSMPPRD